jgi:hypothetical protein
MTAPADEGAWEEAVIAAALAARELGPISPERGPTNAQSHALRNLAAAALTAPTPRLAP